MMNDDDDSPCKSNSVVNFIQYSHFSCLEMSFFRSLFVAVLLLATLIHESASFKRFAGRVQRVAVKRTTVLMAGFGAPKKDVRQQAVDPLRPCACGSGFNYGECCQPYHLGKAFAPNPVKAVRARFSALVYKILPYMIATTHPSHKEYVAPEQKSKMKSWEKDLQTFADEYKFISIAFDDEDRDSKPEGDIATVSFKAKLQREGYDRPPETMEENSKFILTDGKWLYADAEVKNPFKNIRGDVVTPQRKAVTTVKKGVPKSN